MLETSSAAAVFDASDDLISYLNTISVGVSLFRRRWPLPPRGALPPAVGGCAGDPERLQELT